MFGSGANEVLYYNKIPFIKIADRSYLKETKDGLIPIRELIYKPKN